MSKYKKQLGASLLEYVIMAFFIMTVCVAGVTFFGTRVSEKFSNINSSVGNM